MYLELKDVAGRIYHPKFAPADYQDFLFTATFDTLSISNRETGEPIYHRRMGYNDMPMTSDQVNEFYRLQEALTKVQYLIETMVVKYSGV